MSRSPLTEGSSVRALLCKCQVCPPLVCSERPELLCQHPQAKQIVAALVCTCSPAPGKINGSLCSAEGHWVKHWVALSCNLCLNCRKHLCVCLNPAPNTGELQSPLPLSTFLSLCTNRKNSKRWKHNVQDVLVSQVCCRKFLSLGDACSQTSCEEGICLPGAKPASHLSGVSLHWSWFGFFLLSRGYDIHSRPFMWHFAPFWNNPSLTFFDTV